MCRWYLLILISQPERERNESEDAPPPCISLGPATVPGQSVEDDLHFATATWKRLKAKEDLVELYRLS